MKKASTLSCCLLVVLTALLLCGKLACYCIGYRFELASVSLFSFIIALVSVITTVLVLFFGKTTSKTMRILLILSTPLSMVNIFLYLFECTVTLVYVCMIIAAAHTLFLAVWHGKYLVYKILWSILASILLCGLCYLGLFCLIVGSIGHTTVVRTVESPSATYRAEVLDIDQGALGGDTVVDVYENDKHYDFFLFTISKSPNRVYIGNWGEFKSMRIHWKDDQCLVINSKEYTFD